MIDFECPRCGEPMHSPDSLAGGTEFCPNCRKAVEVPTEGRVNDDFDDDDIDDSKSVDSDENDSMMDEQDESPVEALLSHSRIQIAPSHEQQPSRFGQAVVGMVGVIAVLIHWAGGFALHVWTASLYYEHWGSFWALAAFCLPFFAELLTLVLCFGWGVWFYLLACAAWLVTVTVVSVGLTLERDWRISGTYGVLLALLVGSFAYFTVGYATSPRTMTADFQKELDDAATGVCSVLNASSVSAFSDTDVKTSIDLIEDRARLRKKLRRYDNSALAHIRQYVDSYLSFTCLLQGDIKTYTRTRDQDGQAIFALGEATRKGIDKLPSGLKLALGPLQIREMEKELSQRLAVPDNGDPLPAGWEARVQALFDRQWRTYGEVYQDLLGSPMPSPEQLGMNSRSPGS